MQVEYGATEEDRLVTATGSDATRDTEVQDDELSIFDDSKDITVTVSSPKKKLVWFTAALLLAGFMIAKMYGSSSAAPEAVGPFPSDVAMEGFSLSGGPCTSTADCQDDYVCCGTRYSSSLICFPVGTDKTTESVSGCY
eukprot:CAMPEP_0194044912 /NCGR_PEP_ID=MMETSP0009_2-20130614/16311_1 /TAXON_ID=210454 /ORGANISM="Grammatophora oceanica, Strain CCMP 410" /LENGTH=138 /DNA_ID=CAMNT_0038689591 /DNA_START=78 /DNA_END=494 /DNA_ORIENTATION=-